MKNLMFILLSISINFSFGQDQEFKLTNEGFTDYVVIKCEGKTQAELYKKTIDWLAVTYKNPIEVLKGQIENDYVRFEGSSKNLVAINMLGKNLKQARYQVEVSFKDGKCKFDVILISAYNEPSKYSSGGWSDLPLDNMSEYFNKNGKIKGAFKYYPLMIPPYFNELKKSLEDFLLNDQIPSKRSEW